MVRKDVPDDSSTKPASRSVRHLSGYRSIPHEHRQNLRTLAHAAGARSFSDLLLILVQRSEEAGIILAPLVLAIAGTHWKEQALEKVKAAVAREGLSLSDLH